MGHSEYEGEAVSTDSIEGSLKSFHLLHMEGEEWKNVWTVSRDYSASV